MWPCGCARCITGTSSVATRMPLGSVVTLVGLRPRLSGRGGGRSRPGRGRRSESSRAARASAADSRRAAAAAAASNPNSCGDGWDGERRSVSEAAVGGLVRARGASGGGLPCGGRAWRSAASWRASEAAAEGSSSGGGGAFFLLLLSPARSPIGIREGGGVCWAVGFGFCCDGPWPSSIGGPIQREQSSRSQFLGPSLLLLIHRQTNTRQSCCCRCCLLCLPVMEASSLLSAPKPSMPRTVHPKTVSASRRRLVVAAGQSKVSDDAHPRTCCLLRLSSPGSSAARC